ncbi:MAG: DUF2080 family transposase-associated protein [archaeon]
MELIKQITRAGNSANVLLPKEWLGGTARVELIEKPLNIVEDVLKILKPYLKKVLGIYLVGSYARKEETKESDVDILVITENLNKRIKKGKYDVLLISNSDLENTLKKNIMPLLPMIREAKTILNEKLIEKYRKIKPNKENTEFVLGLTKSSRNVCREAIKLSKELNENVSDGIMYSLVLGLRTIYVISSLKKNKIPTIKELKGLVRRLTGSEESYNAYLRAKNEKKTKSVISPEIAEELNNYVLKKL